MIGNLVLNTQAAKPPVGQIDLHLSAELPLRVDRKHVADDQHPDHQHRIDRGSPSTHGTWRTFESHQSMSAFESKADIARASSRCPVMTRRWGNRPASL